MRPLFKRLGRQRGLALLMILVIVVLGTLTVLVSSLNSTDIQIAKQKQTMLALAQAKSALLGFAASYAETHPGQPVGYLPCPDQDGDGSSDILGTSCSGRGKSVLGRFPWRTLGLPPLRDGDGECLWYAVSGNYKDHHYENPNWDKMTLTSDNETFYGTEGLFIVQDASGNVVSPENLAIAIIFSPGNPINGQTREGNNGIATECGRNSAPDDGINQAKNYLDSLATVNNATGGGTFTEHDTTIREDNVDKTNRIFDTHNYLERSTFVTAPLTKEDSNTGKVIFNDTLMFITSKDYESIYTKMDLWVAEKVRTCLKGSSKNSYTPKYATSVPKYETTIGQWEYPADQTYRKTYEGEIDKYVNISKLKYIADFHKKYKDQIPIPDPSAIDIEETGNKAKRNVLYIDEKRLPWPAKLEDVSGEVNYADSEGERFGRIPKTLTATANSSDMDNSWFNGGCFNETGSWSWWKEWKEMVFYAVDSNYVPTSDIFPYFWVQGLKTKCGDACDPTTVDCSQSDTCLRRSDDNTWWVPWVAWLKPPFDEVTDADIIALGNENILTWSQVTQIKDDTLARLKDDSPLQANSWCKVPSQCANSTVPSQLTLDGAKFSYVVLVAGRRLHLNSNNTENGYPEYQQTRNSVAKKIVIKNYLEGQAHPDRETNPNPSNKLRKMTGENIPNDGESDTIPPGDENFFRAKRPVEFDYFNDVACGQSQDCKKSLD